MQRLAALPTSAFAFVMATGIVAIDASAHGYPIASRALGLLAAAAFLALAWLQGLRAVRFRRRFREDLRLPTPAAGALSFVAAAAVLGSLAGEEGRWALAAALGALALLAWLPLAAGVARVIASQDAAALQREVRGEWLLVVVSTQSLAVVAAMLATHLDSTLLAIAAAALWLLGLAIYLPAAALLGGRLGAARLRSEGFTPGAWIAMGALAIAALAAAELGRFLSRRPGAAGLHATVGGIGLAVWAAGTAWIPVLLVLELRHATDGASPGDRWATVFPLGMYAAASLQLDRAFHLPPLGTIASIGSWIALFAWAAAAAGLLSSLPRLLGEEDSADDRDEQGSNQH